MLGSVIDEFGPLLFEARAVKKVGGGVLVVAQGTGGVYIDVIILTIKVGIVDSCREYMSTKFESKASV